MTSQTTANASKPVGTAPATSGPHDDAASVGTGSGAGAIAGATTPRRDTYHHGDLRPTLVAEALRMLEAGEVFSLRAVSRAAGVSQAAPYRHFPDRDHLEGAVAAEGFRDLERDLRAAIEQAGTAVGLVDLAVAYVDFALRRPELFRVMYERPCGDDDERVAAVASLHELIRGVAHQAHPGSDPAALSMAAWSLAHGLAVLHRDGKLEDQPHKSVEEQVRAAFAALIAAR